LQAKIKSLKIHPENLVLFSGCIFFLQKRRSDFSLAY